MICDCAYGCGHVFEELYLFDSDDYYTCPVCGRINYFYSYDYTFQWPDNYKMGVVYYCSQVFTKRENLSGDLDTIMVRSERITETKEKCKIFGGFTQVIELLPEYRYIYFMQVFSLWVKNMGVLKQYL